MITCDKSSCNHCEEIFDSKNKFHNYIRNHECQKLLVIKSISSHKFNLSTFVFIKSIAFKITIILLSSLLTYQFVSPFSSIYELYKKSYFTIVDLYMRYILLSKSQAHNKITRIIIIFFIIFMQDFYKKFHNKNKSIILTSNKIFDFPTKQHATR